MNNFYAYIKLLKNGIIGFCSLMLSNVFKRKLIFDSAVSLPVDYPAKVV